LLKPLVRTLTSVDVSLDESFRFEICCVEKGIIELLLLNALWFCICTKFETLCWVFQWLRSPKDKLFLCVKFVLIKAFSIFESLLDSFGL